MAWDGPPESDESWEASEALLKHEHTFSSDVAILYDDERNVTVLFCNCGAWIELKY